MFYCHLKTTFKTRLSLPKKKTTKKVGPFDSQSVEHVWDSLGLWPSSRCQPQANTSLQGTRGGAVVSPADSFLNTGMCPRERNRHQPLNAHFIKPLVRANRDLKGKSGGTPTGSRLSSHPRISGQLPFCHFSFWLKQIFGRQGRGRGPCTASAFRGSQAAM